MFKFIKRHALPSSLWICRTACCFDGHVGSNYVNSLILATPKPIASPALVTYVVVDSFDGFRRERNSALDEGFSQIGYADWTDQNNDNDHLQEAIAENGSKEAHIVIVGAPLFDRTEEWDTEDPKPFCCTQPCKDRKYECDCSPHKRHDKINFYRHRVYYFKALEPKPSDSTSIRDIEIRGKLQRKIQPAYSRPSSMPYFR